MILGSPSFVFLLLLTFVLQSKQQQQQQPLKIDFPNGWQISYAIEGDTIYFLAMGNNQGYVAIGISEQSDMSNLDVVSFRFDNNQVIIEDRNSVNTPDKPPFSLDIEMTPPGTNDYILDESGEDPILDPKTGVWNIIFYRKLNTQDQYDAQLQGTNIYLRLALLNDFNWVDSPIFERPLQLNQNASTPDNNGLVSQNEISPNIENNNHNSNKNSKDINNFNTTEICYQGICFKPQDQSQNNLSLILNHNLIMIVIILFLS